jgi:hypothetical protein
MLPPDATTVRFNAVLACLRRQQAQAQAQTHVQGLQLSLLQLHAAACAEASRRRLAALVLEASANGLYGLAHALAAWLPSDMPVLEVEEEEEEGALADGAGMQQEEAQAQRPAAAVPLLTHWPVPFAVVDMAAAPADAAAEQGCWSIPCPRYAVLAGSPATAAAAGSPNAAPALPPAIALGFLRYMMEGALVTPLGLRLVHPAAVLQFLVLLARM